MQHIPFILLTAILLLTPQAALAGETVSEAHSAYPGMGDENNATITIQRENSPPRLKTEADKESKSVSADSQPLAGEDTKDLADQTQKKRKPLTPDPNRRWIMKQPKYANTKTSPKPENPIVWKDAAQQERCRTYGEELDMQYKNARYYSIQGDRCKTAHYSGAFLEITEKCKTGCPDAFLKNAGFDSLFIRNMQQLNALGTESCLGKTSPPPGKPSAAEPSTE
jgi:hypothetical protein